MIPPPVVVIPSWTAYQLEILNEVYPVQIPTIAKMTDALVIDIYSAMAGDISNLLYDNLHPNLKGRQVIADTITKSLQPQL